MAYISRQYCNTALHKLVLTTLFLSMLSWTSYLVSASEPNEVRAWLELHRIPKNELQQQIDSSSLPLGSSSTRETIWKPVSQGYGIGDTVATVGRVFKYAIPEETFRGDISRYEVTEAGEDKLPSWLFYNDQTQTLEGIPSEVNMDQYYITVTAYGRETNGSVSQDSDVFSVSVVPELTSQSGTTTATPLHNAQIRGVKCSDDEPAVTATIVLDADWNKLGAKSRMESISKLSQYSRVGTDQFRLLPVGSKSLRDASVLIAGPGNVRRAEHPGIALSWQVGCGSDAYKFPVVTILELASKDGSMAVKLGHNIIGWHVTHDKPAKASRVRRQANLMGTPVQTPTPTDMPPKPTAMRGTTVVPPTRIIPTESSPNIMPPKPTEIEATPVPSSRTFAPPMASMTAVEMTPSMIATIMPSRTFGSVDKTTMGVPVTMKIKPTPVPPTKKPVISTKPNSFPKLQKHVRRVDATELTFLSYRIPENTFYDAEDGNTRKLRLTMLNQDTGEELPESSWVQFNKTKQTIQGLPLAAHVGREAYLIVAQDKQGAAVHMVIELVVKSAPQPSENPPPVTMGMSLDIDFDEFMNNPALQLDIMNRIASVFGDADPSAITFTNIQRGSVVLSWTNNTIPTDGCNAELIAEIMSKLVGPDGQPTQELKDAFYPMEINGVEAIPTGTCASTTHSNTSPIPAMSTAAPGGKGAQSNSSNILIIIIIIVSVIVCLLLLMIGIIICYCRRNRKNKLTINGDPKSFGSKGIPVIFAGETEDVEKPQSSSTPLIMKEEKPPLSPGFKDPNRQPMRKDANKNNSRNRQNVPMVEFSGSPPYRPPPPPLSSSTPKNHNARPGNKPTQRAPPAYVPP